MKTVKLKCVTDGETGELGLVIEGTKIISYPMAANEGLLIAHDLIEHINGPENIGSIDDELEALAGIWYVRGNSGQLRMDRVGSRYSPEENLASDVVNMARIYVEGEVDFKTPVPECGEGDYDETIDCIIEFACKGLESELDEHYDERRLNDYLHGVKQYMRLGFEKFQDLDYDWIQLNNIFWSITEAVEPHAKHCEYEGQEFELEFDVDENTARCNEIYPWDDEEIEEEDEDEIHS